MKITYYVHDIEFPLREGIQKQTWWLAQAMRALGHETEIVSTSKKRKTIKKRSTVIHYGNPISISAVKTDVLHYMTHPTPLIFPLLLRAKAKKQIMTMFDGYLNGFWTRPWYGLISWLANKKIDIITLQTDYQIRLLQKTKIKSEIIKIPPLSPFIKRRKEKSNTPQLLFMTHLHPKKGFLDVIAAYHIVKQQVKNLKLVIADSEITKHSKTVKSIKKLNDDNILFKKIVSPAEELSRCWVYLYPIRHPQETLSVPLSLMEAIQVHTPWISTKVGGLDEYFDKNALIPPCNATALASRVLDLLEKPRVGRLLKKINNEKIVEKFAHIYENSSYL